MTTCEACGSEYKPRCPSRARFCSLCSVEMSNDSIRRDPMLVRYVGYRTRMQIAYGEGPWVPERVAPEDRWAAWVEGREAS